MELWRRRKGTVIAQDVEEEGRKKRKREWELDKETPGPVYPSSASPGATGDVKLLTSVRTVVSGRAALHQGNETPGFYYGPRCIMGGQKESSGGNRLWTMERTEENSCVVFIFILTWWFLFSMYKKMYNIFFESSSQVPVWCLLNIIINFDAWMMLEVYFITISMRRWPVFGSNSLFRGFTPFASPEGLHLSHIKISRKSWAYLVRFDNYINKSVLIWSSLTITKDWPPQVAVQAETASRKRQYCSAL